MRVHRDDLGQIAGSRYGFLIADMILRDTLDEYTRGGADEEELELALQQHRTAYEGYVRRLRELLRPEAEA